MEEKALVPLYAVCQFAFCVNLHPELNYKIVIRKIWSKVAGESSDIFKMYK